MSAIGELKGEIVGVGQEFVDVERDKGNFIQEDVPPIQGRIHVAAGVAVHLAGLLRDIISDFHNAEVAGKGFDERTARATQHLQEIIGDSGALRELLSIVPQDENVVDVRHTHRDSHGHMDSSILLTYAMKADAVAKGLDAMDRRIAEDRADKTIKLDWNIRRVERTVQKTITSF